MMRSLFSGVAGLKTHQTKMDVIGNNIANVNTTAFKSSSIVFMDLMSQTTQNASGPNVASGVGGTNARQIGLGVRSGAINMNIEGQGSAQSTGNPFDIMITGSNFFIVNNGSENFFTRDGSFYVDGAGNLAMTSTGYNVMGWQVDPETQDIKPDTVSALRIMSAEYMNYPAEATSQANMSGIIDRNEKDLTSSAGKAVNLNFYDGMGYSYTAKLIIKQNGDDINSYSIEIGNIIDSQGNKLKDENGNEITNFSKVIGFSIDGSVSSQYQVKQTKLSLNNAYKWDATGKVLQDAGNTPLVDVAALITAIDNYAGGDGWNNLSDIEFPAGSDTTAEDALNEIAKAYNMGGSLDEFLNLYQNVTDPTDGDIKVTMKEALSALATATWTPANGTTKGSFSDPKALQTLMSAEDDNGVLQDVSNDSIIMDGRVYNGIGIGFDKANNGKFAGINGAETQTTAVIGLSALGTTFSDVTIDLSQLSGVDNKGTSTVAADKGDLDGLGTGRRVGEMIGVSIQKDGMIYASYDNGMTRLLGQIATASFPNASGLEKQGDNLYSATQNSGEFNGTGVDITASGGYMSTGQLEMSNVDLSQEFTEMITTQRGFQANSRIITVSDTLLEELTNLKR